MPHIEALLLLYEQPESHWTVDLVAARLYVASSTATGILEDLGRHGLAKTIAGTGPTEYVYDPEWDASGELMARVAKTYRQSLTAVVTFIHSRASRSVREFARAFEFKKGQ